MVFNKQNFPKMSCVAINKTLAEIFCLLELWLSIGIVSVFWRYWYGQKMMTIPLVRRHLEILKPKCIWKNVIQEMYHENLDIIDKFSKQNGTYLVLTNNFFNTNLGTVCNLLGTLDWLHFDLRSAILVNFNFNLYFHLH